MSQSILKQEEYYPLAILLRSYFAEDRETIETQFTRFNEAYLTDLDTKIEAVRTLISIDLKKTNQKELTQILYDYADKVDEKLTVLVGYYSLLNLPSALVKETKESLRARNIEGAANNLHLLQQEVAKYNSRLQNEGMPTNMVNQLITDKDTLIALNQEQERKKDHKTEQIHLNKEAYKELFEVISEICKIGKLVFKDDPVKIDRYTISTLVGRMRAPKR